MSDSVLIIGGGIAGVQAALDLADAGAKVYLVERTPSLGGRMAQLDKTFPTNDCSMCIESPRLVEAARHPRINVLTLSELERLEGRPGNFRALVRKHPSYVDAEKCVGCGACTEKCPVKVPNEFELGMATRKAIYVPFAQAVPLKYSIDPEHCLKLQKDKCGNCEKACPAGAIDYRQKGEEIILEVASVIVATGFDQFDPSNKPQYNYQLPDVITGLEYERILSASGPTGGHIQRPSDKKEPKHVAFVQCVGSRDKKCNEYCSRVCCMYSVKQAIITKEHAADIKTTIIYQDLRAFGKGFEEYYQRSKKDIEYLWGRAASVEQLNGSLLIRTEDIKTGKTKEIQADLVVLASAIIPSERQRSLAKTLGIQLDKDGLFQNVGEDHVRSSREGVYLAGCAQAPRDIPDSVAMAGAAASRALAHVTERRPSEAKPVPMNGEGEPKIGVFICHCGSNIAGTVNIEEVVRHAKTLDGVIYAGDNVFTCSESTQGELASAIKERGINRVVVAACSPRTHEPLFRETLGKAGLNPYLFEMANIRDQCSWVHMKDKLAATEKAKALVASAVAKARNLQPLQKGKAVIEQRAVIIGGGLAGLHAATTIARLGIETIVIEKSGELGGHLLDIDAIAISGMSAGDLLISKLRELRMTGVKTRLSTELAGVSGSLGHYELQLRTPAGEESLTAGAIILATGFEPYKPAEFRYDQMDNVVTGSELEQMLRDRSLDTRNAAVVLCVGARNAKNPGCGRTCCLTGIHHAIQLRKTGANVTVLYRDIRTFSKGAEELYKQASEAGIKFIPYDIKDEPVFDGEKVVVRDRTLNEPTAFPADLLILETAMKPRVETAKSLRELLKVPLGQDHFFLELHPKLGPAETNTAGVYLAGCCQAPRDIPDTLAHAGAAAIKAAAVLVRKSYPLDGAIASVNKESCRGCGNCAEACPYGAPSIQADEHDNRFAEVDPALCKGCGVCAAVCPTGAMTHLGFTSRQVEAQLDAVLKEVRT